MIQADIDRIRLKRQNGKDLLFCLDFSHYLLVISIITYYIIICYKCIIVTLYIHTYYSYIQHL